MVEKPPFVTFSVRKEVKEGLKPTTSFFQPNFGNF